MVIVQREIATVQVNVVFLFFFLLEKRKSSGSIAAVVFVFFWSARFIQYRFSTPLLLCVFFYTRRGASSAHCYASGAARARARANDNLSAETANSATAVVERWRWGVHGNIFLLIRWAVVAVETATIALFPKCADISKNVPVPFSGEGGWISVMARGDKAAAAGLFFFFFIYKNEIKNDVGVCERERERG